MDRYLDGIYFRVKRDGKYENICFSDLTEEEMRNFLNEKDKGYKDSLIAYLRKYINKTFTFVLPEKEKSDLMNSRIDKMIADRDTDKCVVLGKLLHAIGDEFDIYAE